MLQKQLKTISKITFQDIQKNLALSETNLDSSSLYASSFLSFLGSIDLENILFLLQSN